MLSYYISALVGVLLCNYGDGACSSHSDCVRFATVTSDRRYCCGENFCCTFLQLEMGVTEDPFASMSIPAIVGIVAGVLIFLSICGILLYCLLKGPNKRSLNRTPRNSGLEDHSTTDLRLEPQVLAPVNKMSPDYDYPPDAFDLNEPPSPYPHKIKAIPTVIGSYGGSFKYSKKRRNVSRYAYDGPAAYDFGDYEYRHHSRAKNSSSYPENQSRDLHGRHEDSHDQRYHGEKYSKDARYHTDQYRRDHRYLKDEYSGDRQYSKGDYSWV